MSSFIYGFLVLHGVLFTLELFAFCPIYGHVFKNPQSFIQGFPESISPKGDRRSQSALFMRTDKKGDSIITKYKLKKYTGVDYRPLNASDSSATTLANISEFLRKTQLLDTLQRIHGTIASGVPSHFLKWRLVDDMLELLNNIESHEDLGTIMPPNINDIHPANLYAGGLMRNYDFDFF